MIEGTQRSELGDRPNPRFLAILGDRPRADPDMADPTSKQRLTKAERKEEAKRQRVELQRKMAKSRRNRRVSMIVVVALIAGVGVYALTRPEEARADPQELLATADQTLHLLDEDHATGRWARVGVVD